MSTVGDATAPHSEEAALEAIYYRYNLIANDLGRHGCTGGTRMGWERELLYNLYLCDLGQWASGSIVSKEPVKTPKEDSTGP